ncbi:queuosine biosynthesis protein QueD [Solidesulfovibrio carbinoliphilus subsp. oakridgensis]|uniref:6-carboxy-5,6,7,8-tetrahydropterin synthase n=1 Tax=Solidesulfovibrio carbinoliphilus subsp. oakridgensis TaxID=694327 RepID=G7QCS5_9BACT|nr:6-carboxytetrahydropterin synthase QueD [Solidesulfovibrio carbinoliphilus]EHJ46231.1 queuosine biosynthesis protein QueD [Solidesulfovibrio carbinoliphilus subsp. oakridgensis]
MLNNKRGVWQLTVTESFSASHCLRGYEGPCENLHGHNFGVEAVVEGERLDAKVEYLMDFKKLRGRLRGILAELDHRHLNDVAPFDGENPSSENLARHIYRRLEAALAGEAVTLVAVSVSEKDTSKATYREL